MSIRTEHNAPALVAVREAPLSIDECYRAVERPECGAVALFVGRVRDHNQGQAVTLLEYEAYPSMAEKEIRSIIEQLQQDYPGALLSCTHRYGALRVGDVAVVCAASAAHREQAFAACRQLIEQVKARVPIWKREHGPDGPYWIGWQDVRDGH